MNELYEEIDRLRAEVDRLNEANKDLCVRLLEKEEANKELVEALEKISKLDYSRAATNFSAYDAVTISNAAIANARSR